MKKQKARLQELRAMPYDEYLQTPEWQKTRKLALRRTGGHCQQCEAEGDLEIYHLSGDNIGCEQESDVIALCEQCFSQISADDGGSREIPNVPFKYRATVFTSTAVIGIGLPALFHAPLPLEAGGLIAAIVLAIKCPQIYASVKEGLPAPVIEFIENQAERRELRRQEGSWSILDRLMGRHLQEPEEISDEDVAAYLRANGLDEQLATLTASSIGLSPIEGERSLLPAISKARASASPLSSSAIHEMEVRLSHALEGFHINARVLPEVTAVGPRVIRFGVEPTGVAEKLDGNIRYDDAGNIIYAKRTRVDEITKRAKDIQLALGAESLCVALVPGQHYLGIEMPNPDPAYVTLTEVLESAEYKRASASSKLVFALGRDITGKVQVCDIEKAPHILIGGATNAGKSVLLNVLIASLMTNATPEDIRLIMIDPKMVELTPYDGVAHLLEPVITDMAQVPALLKKTIAEMERRYRIFAGLGVRKLSEYRKKRERMPKLENLPSWVIIVDEFADLMMTAPEETDDQICRLAQKARATGIHLVIATQRPSVDVITGTIKANIPTRIALTASSVVDSRVILDHSGAERLLGNGDMLYLPADAGRPERIQGAYMTDAEADEIVAYWKTDEKTDEDEEDYWEDDITPSTNCEVSVPSQRLTTDALVAWWTQGQINDEQFLTLMEKVSGRVTDELEGSVDWQSGLVPNLRVLRPGGRNVPTDRTLQKGPKHADCEASEAGTFRRSDDDETASEEDGSPQYGGVTTEALPTGWTAEKLNDFPGFYRALNHLDKALAAVGVSQSQRNRDYGRKILRDIGLWKEVR